MQFLKREKTALVLIDIQEKLFPAINNRQQLLANVSQLISGAQVLDIPILITEQYSKGLGLTLPKLQKILQNYAPIEKMSFSCCGSEEFNRQLTGLNRNQILVTGIETHVCVYQTCKDLDNNGYDVHLVTDCVSSRKPENKQLAIDKLQKENEIFLTSSEMALFELLKSAEDNNFKTISKIVK